MSVPADVNSLCTSCEKVSRPDLRSRPVVTLGSNDGRVIVRSAEVKRLGIKTGVLWFQLKTMQSPGPVITFSNNYEFYASVPNRVMSRLKELASRVEWYSIDETFLGIRGIDSCVDFEDFRRQLREHVQSGAGLTIDVGMRPTKTLARSARWASEEWRQSRGTLALASGNPKRMEKLLSLQPVNEIRGVGRRVSKKLSTMGIMAALQLARTNPVFIRKSFNAVLERTIRELNGESCISLEGVPPSKQQIICSRSLGERITTYEAMWQAICQYIERAAEKLRGEHQFCRHIAVFAKTLPFAVNEPYYGDVASEKPMTPMQGTRDIIATAVKALDRIWVNDHRYAKAGCIFNDFTPTGIPQLDLFDDAQPRSNSSQPMEIVNGINHLGLGKAWFTGRGIAPEWQTKRGMLSSAYTTRRLDLPIAKLRRSRNTG